MPSTINIATAADSDYNGLQVVINKRVSHGLEFQVAYTYSKVMDDTQGQANVADCFTSFGLQGTYPLDQHIDRGPACFDSTNNLEASAVYHFPAISIRQWISLYGGQRLVDQHNCKQAERLSCHAACVRQSFELRSFAGTKRRGGREYAGLNCQVLSAHHEQRCDGLCTSMPGDNPRTIWFDPLPLYSDSF